MSLWPGNRGAAGRRPGPLRLLATCRGGAGASEPRIAVEVVAAEDEDGVVPPHANKARDAVSPVQETVPQGDARCVAPARHGSAVDGPDGEAESAAAHRQHGPAVNTIGSAVRGSERAHRRRRPERRVVLLTLARVATLYAALSQGDRQPRPTPDAAFGGEPGPDGPMADRLGEGAGVRRGHLASAGLPVAPFHGAGDGSLARRTPRARRQASEGSSAWRPAWRRAL